MRKVIVFLLLVSCAQMPTTSSDPYLWLEDIEGVEPLKWVEAQNKITLEQIGKSSSYQQMEKDTLQILEAKDKIPSGMFQGNQVINFWRDDVHVRGLIRRASFENYKKKDVVWETVLDIDELAKKENENWVYKGFSCLEPKYEKCLVTLSRGGKDASVIREFDAKKKVFVKNGFILQEAKTWVDWADSNSLLVATDFGPGTLTESGYSRQIRLWKRGTPLSTAKMLLEVMPSDVGATPARLVHKNKVQIVLSREIDFFNTEEFILDLKTAQKKPLPKPAAAELNGYFEEMFIYKLRNPWNFGGVSYVPGAVISISQKAIGRELQPADVQLIFSPKENQSVASVMGLKSKVIISLLEDVKSQVLVTEFKSGKWLVPASLNLGTHGTISLASGRDDKDLFMYLYENFDQPSTLYSFDFTKQPTKLKSAPDRFDAKELVIEQKFATSKDDTKIPYFLVYKKGTVMDGSAPTLQYGYGGFTVSQIPTYNATVGKLWLEKGGVFVVANIRGGGEYGPKWHQAALKENRQKAYDDFIAVSEDLIRNKVTSSQKLAIRGGSNGGLLVGAVMVQRPDLYGAVLCSVPLLDMLRYSQLLAGASWMSEYGDPQDSTYRRAILKYSPYQNVNKDKKYPPTLFITSTKDDRVHPGHARKMAARMLEYKQPIMYYENTEGGHAAGANFKQMARITALQYEFLMKTIGAGLKK